MALIDRPAARALRRTPEVAEPAVSAAEEAVSARPDAAGHRGGDIGGSR